MQQVRQQPEFRRTLAGKAVLNHALAPSVRRSVPYAACNDAHQWRLRPRPQRQLEQIQGDRVRAFEIAAAVGEQKDGALPVEPPYGHWFGLLGGQIHAYAVVDSAVIVESGGKPHTARIDKCNRTGIDTALGPPGRLPFDDPLDLAWAIVDLALTRDKPTVVTDLHAHGVKVIADSSAWRYRETSTFAIDSMTNVPYAPGEPLGATGTSIADFIERELRVQEACHVDA
jgi:hypothetical protein